MRSIFGKHSPVKFNVKKDSVNEKSNEMDIYYYIRTHNIPIKYDPRKDRKADVLRKLKDGGYI